MNWIRKKPAQNLFGKDGARKKPAISLSTGYKMVNKDEAGYVNYSRKNHCEDCKMFRPPGTCTLVRGDISMVGTCRFWEIKARLLVVD